MRPKSFKQSQRDYERWLTAQLDEIWMPDLRRKHEKMQRSAFIFLRATYWRWAEEILATCPDLAGAPTVVAVGDIHLENYGVWRDDDGRLVWGVNDFDEAADMPYALDVVRLATSAVLACAKARGDRKAMCSTILDGYREGVANPRPFILDEHHPWLRTRFVVSEEERARFWEKMAGLQKDERISKKYRNPLQHQMPGTDAAIEKFARRTAGTGSLGRPRWVAVADWRGGRLVREAKALVTSAWTLAHPGARKRSGALITAGRYRAPDPWYWVQDDVVVRRLSPNARKIEVRDRPGGLCDAAMLRAMGHELANIHLGTGDVSRAIHEDLARRRNDWLNRATEKAAEFVTNDFNEWCR